MAVSVRLRFEVFKRDAFTCRYCGRKTPEVVLEIDHVIPESEGGSDDAINLVTSCWECNRGKSNIPLNHALTGEDPHDKAIEMMERDRQLREYNHVLREIRERREESAWELWEYWDGEDSTSMSKRDLSWFLHALERCPAETIRKYMDMAIHRGFTDNLRWVKACVRNHLLLGWDGTHREETGHHA